MDRLQEAVLMTSVIMVLLYPITASFGVSPFANVVLSFGIVGIAISLLTLITKKLRWMLYLWVVGFFVYFLAILFATIF
ncbi:hypothetical protein M1278_01360 [Candidatus Marsarchaeota archaeon]|nr:hypothetical protein [Candidatus Marsarchaeota archaeon]